MIVRIKRSDRKMKRIERVARDIKAVQYELAVSGDTKKYNISENKGGICYG